MPPHHLKAGLLLASTMLAAQPVLADDLTEASFFKDKTVRILVGYGPGGGFDTYARLLVPYLAKKLGANVIVENMPGAGGISALNRTAASPPDGLNLQLVNGTGAALAQLFEIPAVRYNFLELGHVGTIAVSPWMWMVGPTSPIRTAADAMKPGVVLSWAASGPTDGLADGAALTCEALKLNCRVVIGYKGTSDATIAVIRGEMDAIYISDSTANSMAKSGNARAVATIGRTRSLFFPSTPLISETTSLDRDATWLIEFRGAADDLGRILVAPPNMPPGRLTFLRTVLKATLSDPGLLAEATRTQRNISFLDAGVTIGNVRKVLSEPTPEQRERIKAIIAKSR
jgi:tripartite-type tricarboxylate transporter receptor subunit TctC